MQKMSAKIYFSAFRWGITDLLNSKLNMCKMGAQRKDRIMQTLLFLFEFFNSFAKKRILNFVSTNY